MKFEEENYKRAGLMKASLSVFHGGPDVSHAAKEGAPTMTNPKKTIPASIPIPANTETAATTGGAATGTTEVTASTVGPNSALDTKSDARQGSQPLASTPEQPAAPLPTNRDKELKLMQKERAKKQAQIDKKNKKKKTEQPATDSAPPPAATATPAASTSGTAAPPATAPAPSQQQPQ
jgi:hypothetical protein